MPALISTLLGFFSSTGPIASLFLWLGKKLSVKAIILPIQFTAMGALVTAKIAFLTTAISLVFWVYNRIHDLFDMIDGFVNSDGLLSVSFQVLRSIGFIDAFVDTFTSLSFVIVSALSLLVAKYALHSLKLASDELFKIGLLLGQ
jgi:hypothetical protein